MPAAIEIKNLTKQYPVPLKREVVNAVDNLSLTVGEGEIFGFLGANGAGKTTTIKILLGLIYATQGEASVLGRPAGDIEMKHQVSYLPESPYFYEHMTATEVVLFYAQLFGMKYEDARKKAEKWVDFVGLGGKANRNKRISEFSKGMRQRVGIAQSLVNDPKLLFYDEPTSGLDAIARRDIRDLMLELKSQGRAMFLSSHQLEDVEAVCHRISIIHNGKLRVIGSVGELLQGERVEIRVSGISSDLAAKLKAVAPDAIVVESRTVFTEKNDPDAILAIMDLVRNNGGRIEAIVPKRRTLEDLFVEIVGERIDKGDGGTAFTASDAFPSVASSSHGDGIATSAPDRPNGNGNGDVAYTDAFNRTESPIAAAETDEASIDAAGADAPATTKTRRPGANKYKELNGK